LPPRVKFLFSLLWIPSILFGQSELTDLFAGISGQDSVESEVVRLVNAERKKMNLGELIPDVQLRSAARQHSHEMLDSSYFSHVSPEPRWPNAEDRVRFAGLTDFVVGENIALNSADGSPTEVARALVEQWMNSPGHRENILRPTFTHIGVGVVGIRDTFEVTKKMGNLVSRTQNRVIRNIGTQVFSDRDLDFDALRVHIVPARVLHIRLRFRTERSLLLTFGSWSREFESAAGQCAADFRISVDEVGELQIAYAENEMTREFVVFHRIPITPRTETVKLYSSLEGSKFPLLDKEFEWMEGPLRTLLGEFKNRHAGADDVVVSLGDGTSYRIKEGKFSIPLMEDSGQVDFASGSGRKRSVKHRVMISGGDKKDSFSRQFEADRTSE